MDRAIYVAEAENSSTVENSPRVVSILALFMEIEERARSQYNYSMSENDRAFALFLMENVFNALNQQTPGDSFAIEEGGRDPNTAPGELLRILEGYAARGDDTLGEEELSNRMQFEAFVVAIEQFWIDAIDSGDIPTPGEVNDWFEEFIDGENWPPFAIKRLRSAAARVNNYAPGAAAWEEFE